MSKKRTILGAMASNYKRKATNSANQAAYMLMWGEKPPKGKIKTKAK